MSFGIPEFGTWATEANYTSGFSSGLPTKVAPPGDLFFPNVALPAPLVNWILNAIAADITVTFAKSLDKSGDTITGGLTFNATGQIVANQIGAIQPSLAKGITDGGVQNGIAASVPGGVSTLMVTRDMATTGTYTMDSSGRDEYVYPSAGNQAVMTFKLVALPQDGRSITISDPLGEIGAPSTSVIIDGNGHNLALGTGTVATFTLAAGTTLKLVYSLTANVWLKA